MTTNQDVNTPVIAVVGFLGVTLLFAIVVLLQVVFYQFEARQSQEKDLGERPLELGKLMESQQAQLAEYRWADQEKKIVAIPIRRAMDLVVKDLSRQTGKAAPNGPAGDRSPSSDTHRAKEPSDAK